MFLHGLVLNLDGIGIVVSDPVTDDVGQGEIIQILVPLAGIAFHSKKIIAVIAKYIDAIILSFFLRFSYTLTTAKVKRAKIKNRIINSISKPHIIFCYYMQFAHT